MMMVILYECVGVGNLRTIEEFVVHIGSMMSRVVVVMEPDGSKHYKNEAVRPCTQLDLTQGSYLYHAIQTYLYMTECCGK